MAEKTLKEQIEAFKNDLKDFFSVSEKSLDFKVADGTIVRCDTDQLQKGSKVDVLDEKGQVLPMPNGEYVQADTGMKFTVESGYVKDVVQAEAAPANPAEMADPNAAPPAADMPDMKAIVDAINQLGARLDKIEQAINADAAADTAENADMEKINQAHAALKKDFEKQGEMVKKLFALVEEIANSTEEPTNKPANRSVNTDSDEDKIKKFRKQYLNA